MEFLHLSTAGLFLHEVSLFCFLNENKNDEWKTNGAHPKINNLEFGDIYRYDKKN